MKKRKRAKKKSTRFPRKKAIIAFVLGVVLVTTLTFFFIDAKVRDRISGRSSDKVPAFYSDTIRISSRLKVSVAQLEAMLKRRGYVASNSRPSAAGEYQIADGVLHLKTRAFELYPGRENQSVEINYGPQTGKIINVTNSKEPFFFLEPEVLEELANSSRRASQALKLAQIPERMQNALIATEDQRFYSHLGIDVVGLARALFVNLRAMAFVQGGSTITQQLAKNLFFSPKKTIWRKFLEVFAALSLELRLTKKQILEMYLNEVYLGQDGAVAIHGVGEAAHAFFGKEISRISVGEAALLAGIIRAPSYYAPRKHLKRATEQRNKSLEKMFDAGMISAEEKRRASEEKITLARAKLYERKVPHFSAALRKELDPKINFESAIQAGVAIRTGINLDLQNCAETALEQGLKRLEEDRASLHRRSGQLEAGLVSIEPFSGKIRAWVGGRDFSHNQFDHVAQATRQIGSTVKPFLYLTALDPTLNAYKAATPMSLLPDKPLSIELVSGKNWEPENYDHKFHGDVTLRYALERSLNSPAVFVAERVGIKTLAHTARAFHVAQEVKEVPAIALGAVDTTLLDLSAAYGALANGGRYVNPRLFLSVNDPSEGELLSNEIIEDQVADEGAVFVLTNILQGVIERGTGRVIRQLGYSGTAAGKTGTSDEGRNSWFVGYSPDLVSGVWVGYDDNAPTDLSGAVAAAPIWANYMKCAAPFVESTDFLMPPNVTLVKIDQASNALATSHCPAENIIEEVYLRGSEPQRPCPLHSPYSEELDNDRVPQPHETPERPRRKRSLWDILFG